MKILGRVRISGFFVMMSAVLFGGALPRHWDPSLLLIPGGSISINLGEIDSGMLAHSLLQVGNFGEVPRSVLPVVGVFSAKAVIHTPLILKPSDVLAIPVEVDAHGLEGLVNLVVEIRTSDPGAKTLRQVLTATVVSTTEVHPYRGTVMATRGENGIPVGSSVPFDFLPGPKSGPFVGAELEDPSAPLVITWLQTPAGGIHGEISVDPTAVMRGAPLQGETRVLGRTAGGNQNFITFQWWVK